MKQPIKTQPPAEQITIAQITIRNVSLEPLRKILLSAGADGTVKDIDDIIGLVLLHLEDESWDVKYLKEKLYALHCMRMAFTEVERLLHKKKEEKETRSETHVGYNIEPLQKMLYNFPPINLTTILSSALSYIYKYGAIQLEKTGKGDIELEDVADSLKELSKAFLQMAKEADKVS